MHHVAEFLFSILSINIFVKTIAQNNTSDFIDSLNINDIADALIQALVVNRSASNVTRIDELKEKLNKISNYAIDKQKYALLLTNVTVETNLTEINFFKSLNEDDEFKFLKNTEPKNLYLQLKERMNRDDILKIIAEKSLSDKLTKSARKAMGQDYFGTIDNEKVLNVVVDKLLGETPHDEHKFDVTVNHSMYWDPQGELQDLKEHHRHDGRRIFKGQRTTVRYYPFMVSIHVLGRFWCGGVIYWQDLVLTSAACLQLMHNNRFFRENPKVVQVRVGSNHSRIGGEILDAMEVYFHPAYNPRNLQNNLALIRLRRRLSFTYHRIPKLIEISNSPYGMPDTAEVLLLGWGVTKTSQKMSYEPVYLQRKFLPIYPNTFCKEVYGDKFITQTMFCAGTFTTGEGACDHDAGGPAVLAGRLVGIISFGPAVCGYPNAPTVFTLVGAFSDWIETVNESMPDYYHGRRHTTTSTRRPLFEYLATLYPETYTYVPSESIEIHPLELDTERNRIPLTTEAPLPSPAASETPGMRYLKDQFSDEDSWGDK